MGQIKLVALLAVATCLPLAAQENWCSNRGGNDGMVTHSEVREQHLPVAGQNVVNPQQNGSIHVHGWANSDILVKACVQASAHDEGSAEMLAKQVTIADGAGQIVARGPGATGDNEWWSVSYDIWVPASANLQLEANNGSIHVEGTLGQIRGHTENGSVTLRGVGGDVEVETTNGSLNINPTSASSLQNKRAQVEDGERIHPLAVALRHWGRSGGFHCQWQCKKRFCGFSGPKGKA